MRTLPKMRILSPADPGEAKEAVSYLCANPGPSYLRLGKAGEKMLHPVVRMSSSPVLVANGSSDVAIVATGSILSLALEAASVQSSKGVIPPTVFSMPWIHPAGTEIVLALQSYKHVVCLEEHIPQGGLCELLSALLPRCIKVSGLSIPCDVNTTVGSQGFLRDAAGLTLSRLLERVVESPL